MASSWLGIDFSGDIRRWRPRCGRSNVWIAELRVFRGTPYLDSIRRVQDLGGNGTPFENLAELLQTEVHEAVAIDAPFSIPDQYVRSRTYAQLLDIVAGLDRQSRYFPEAKKFVHGVTGVDPPLSPPKPYRDTDQRWVDRRLNVRSTLWAGARPGAAMTAACMTLLATVRRPIWPFKTAARGTVVEAFPAAQLYVWKLPRSKYDGDTGRRNRDVIVDSLALRVALGAHVAVLRSSADATDAVVSAFAALAVSEGGLYESPSLRSRTEGWIAVHL
jgi:predicted nuclease with RNAse H fold